MSVGVHFLPLFVDTTNRTIPTSNQTDIGSNDLAPCSDWWVGNLHHIPDTRVNVGPLTFYKHKLSAMVIPMIRCLPAVISDDLGEW